ncbi:MAG: LysE family translocator [Prochloraceae cyanobacterium]
MTTNLLIQGALIGFSVAAPIGVNGLICIKRTLTQGKIAGFISGLGAATAHGIFSSVAGLGLTYISSFLLEQEFWLRLIGGLVICSLGAKTFMSKPPKQDIEVNQNSSLMNAYLTTLLLSFTNPLTILSFAAIFSGSSLTSTINNSSSTVEMIAGVFVGSACWWLILSSGVGYCRKWLSPKRMRLLNYISGVIIAALGVVAISSVRTNPFG